jgi:hypothetical protein
MAEDHYTREFFRQARTFENLETVFDLGKPTEKDLTMAQVCKVLAEVCMMLADLHSEEGEKKEAEA